MKEYVDALRFEIETAQEVFEHFNAEPIFDAEIIENEFGGNPTLKVSFTYKARRYNGANKEFTVNPASCSVEMFRNEIKAYMYDCVYGFISLLY